MRLYFGSASVYSVYFFPFFSIAGTIRGTNFLPPTAAPLARHGERIPSNAATLGGDIRGRRRGGFSLSFSLCVKALKVEELKNVFKSFVFKCLSIVEF